MKFTNKILILTAFVMTVGSIAPVFADDDKDCIKGTLNGQKTQNTTDTPPPAKIETPPPVAKPGS